MRGARTIYPRLTGGLGNQMFQIAAAMGLAERLDCNWACPEGMMDFHGLRNPPDVYRPTLFRKLPFSRPGSCSLIREYRWSYHWIRAPRLDTDWMMSGYWQSPRYWEQCAAKVCETFDLSWWTGAEEAGTATAGICQTAVCGALPGWRLSVAPWQASCMRRGILSACAGRVSRGFYARAVHGRH